MTLRVSASAMIGATPERTWAELTDWTGQSRWIPLTTVRVGEPRTGLGVRVVALSGFWLGRLPIGLLDRFVVTDWSAPENESARLEVLHLGPIFTGPGAFVLRPADGGTRVQCIEVVDLIGGRLVEVPARLLLPLMRRALSHSLRRLAAICAA